MARRENRYKKLCEAYDKGVKEAYLMDGGQTAEIIFNNDIRNNISYGSERAVSDIIYFATAVQN